MHFLSTLLLSIFALAASPAFSVPILPNVDSLEARSIGDGSVDRRFIPDPAAAVTLLQLHHRSLVVEKRGSEELTLDGRNHPYFVMPPPPKPVKPPPVTSNDRSKHLSRRDTGSDTTETKGQEAVLGRIVHLGKKLARLFYHPSHEHTGASQAEFTSHRTAQKGGEDKEGSDD